MVPRRDAQPTTDVGFRENSLVAFFKFVSTAVPIYKGRLRGAEFSRFPDPLSRYLKRASAHVTTPTGIWWCENSLKNRFDEAGPLGGKLKMSLEEAKRLLKLSREARWSYPSSQGGDVVRQDSELSKWTDGLALKREAFSNAIEVLVRNGFEEEAVEIAANIWRLWLMARDVAAGRKFLDTALGATKKKSSKNRALALYGNGLFAFHQHKLDDSQRYNQEALEIAEKIKDREALALANLGLSRVAYEQANYKQARSLATKALELFDGLDPSLGQAPLFMKALSTRMLADYDTAAELFRKSVDLNRNIGDQGMVSAELQNLGLVEAHQGNYESAEKHFKEAETMGSGGDPYGAAMVQLQKAIVAYGRRDQDQAHQLLASSKSLLGKAGIDPGPDDKFEIEWLERQLRR
jgi:tetratricopeptide (TPR) repeat protein